MRILVIGRPDAADHLRLIEAGRKLGHPTTVVPMHDVRFRFGKTSFATVHGKRIDRTFGAICFRSLHPYISESLLLAEWHAAKGIRIMDSRLARRDYVNSKAYETWKLRESGIPTVDGIQPMSRASARDYLATARFPLIVKGVHGTHGRHVHLCHNRSEALPLVRRHDDGFFLFQPFIDVREEYRVLVLGGRYLGAMRKHDIPGDFRRNIALGGSGESANLAPKLRRLCVRAAKALDNDLAGVDLAITKRGEPIIFEVNRSPGFVGFEKATGMDVASQVITFLSQ